MHIACTANLVWHNLPIGVGSADHARPCEYVLATQESAIHMCRGNGQGVVTKGVIAV